MTESIIIPLASNRWLDKDAIIDAADYPLVAAYHWMLIRSGGKRGKPGNRCYAFAYLGSGPTRRRVLMHNLIADPLPGYEIDHVNGDGLDNRRENLRHATRSQNIRNKRKTRSDTSSDYKGVTLRHSGRWQASIRLNGDRIHLGCYENEQVAAHIYDAAAQRLFGTFARLNFDQVPSDADSIVLRLLLEKGIILP